MRMNIYGDGDDLLSDAPFGDDRGMLLLMVMIFMYGDATDAV